MTTMPKDDYKVVTYPIPGEENGGTLLLLGRPTAKRLVFLCPGFPDDASTMLPLARRFSHNCLVGITCLPGFDKIRNEGGYTFAEWVYCLREAVKTMRAHARRPSAKLTFILHDWACIAGQMLTTRLLEDGFDDLIPNELVLLDVCMPPHSSVDTSHLDIDFSFIETLYTCLSLLAYSLNFLITYCIFYYSSQDLCTFFFLAGWKLQNWVHLDPLHWVDSDHIINRYSLYTQHNLQLLMYMTYPHFYLWRNFLLRKGELQTAHLPIDLVRTPILFLYGQDKNIQFHSPTTLAVLQEEFMSCRRSKAVEIPNAGHWLHIQQEQVVYNEIVKFLTNDCVRFQPFEIPGEGRR